MSLAPLAHLHNVLRLRRLLARVASRHIAQQPAMRNVHFEPAARLATSHEPQHIKRNREKSYDTIEGAKLLNIYNFSIILW